MIATKEELIHTQRILRGRVEIRILAREDKIRIPKRLCNVLFIQYRY